MTTEYRCGTAGRRQLMLAQTAINGIDFLVVHAPTELRVRCFSAAGLGALSAANVTVRGGVRVRDPATLRVQQLAPDSPWLQIILETTGDFSIYRLALRASESSDTPPVGFDVVLSEVEFSFKVDCPSPFDCARPDPGCAIEAGPGIEIDYLARDFASFRRLLFDRLALTQPADRSRDPATQRATVVELLAHEADLLAYFQDAVATEAYLGTARRRSSVRRHARLLDYAMHDGCNARAFVQVATAGAAGMELPAGATLLTRVPGRGTLIPVADLATVLAAGPEVFETLHPLALHSAHDEIAFHTWGDEDCCLPRGATTAALVVDASPLALVPGDFLLLEEVRGRTTGLPADADPDRRHVVRLVEVAPPLRDGLGGVDVVEVRWHAADALPFTLAISADGARLAVARGNIVLVDHGRSIAEDIAVRTFGNQGHHRAHLARRNLTFRERYDAFEVPTPGRPPQLRSAGASLLQDPRRAAPAIVLDGEGVLWRPQRDLLGSAPSEPEVVVEVETDGDAWIRFGDGVHGRAPAVDELGRAVDGRPFVARYRVGNGPAGNVGAGAIAHLVTDVATAAVAPLVASLHNLAAGGGTRPESIEEAQLYAPHAFRHQQRAVTEEDWVAAVERHPRVQHGAATIRWTGMWNTVFLAVDLLGGGDVSSELESELLAFLEPFRLAGYDLELGGPRYVALDVTLAVCVAPGHLLDEVERRLYDELGSGVTRDRTRAFFHPDNYTFGQTVYLSQLIARAARIAGVERVEATRFQRRGEAARGELDRARIEIDRLEIARCDSDPNAPEHGQVRFVMLGHA